MSLADSIKDVWRSVSELVEGLFPCKKAPAQPRYNPHAKSNSVKLNLFRGDPQFSRYNSCVGDNEATYNLYDYAEGYFEATLLLLQEAKKLGARVAIIGYPVCLNFRHALELYIKYLITELSKVARIDATYKLNQSLKANWKVAKKLMNRTTFLAAQEQVAVIENAVNNLMEVDPKGDIFRYTESIMDDQHLKDWSDINLEVIELHYRKIFGVAKLWHYNLESLLDR